MSIPLPYRTDWPDKIRSVCWKCLFRCLENATVSHRLTTVSHGEHIGRHRTDFPRYSTDSPPFSTAVYPVDHERSTVSHNIPSNALCNPVYPTVSNTVFTVFHGMPPTSHGIHRLPTLSHGMVLLRRCCRCCCCASVGSDNIPLLFYRCLSLSSSPVFPPSRVGNRASPNAWNVYLRKIGAAFGVDDELYMVSRFR